MCYQLSLKFCIFESAMRNSGTCIRSWLCVATRLTRQFWLLQIRIPVVLAWPLRRAMPAKPRDTVCSPGPWVALGIHTKPLDSAGVCREAWQASCPLSMLTLSNKSLCQYLFNAEPAEGAEKHGIHRWGASQHLNAAKLYINSGMGWNRHWQAIQPLRHFDAKLCSEGARRRLRRQATMLRVAFFEMRDAAVLLVQCSRCAEVSKLRHRGSTGGGQQDLQQVVYTSACRHAEHIS